MVRCNMRLGAAVLAVLLLICASSARAADFTVFDGKTVPVIVADADKPQVAIRKAGELLSRDLGALTGVAPSVVQAESANGPAIIIGQMNAPLVARLLSENHIDTA